MLIGIVYRGSSSELKGCINDTRAVLDLLQQHARFRPDATNLRLFRRPPTTPCLCPPAGPPAGLLPRAVLASSACLSAG